MTAPTSPWNIPLFAPGDTIPSLEGVLNSVSTALNTALSSAQTGFYLRYATRALMNANTTAVTGQHAAVYADGNVYNNGDYVWSGTAWIGAFGGDTGWQTLTNTGLSVTISGAQLRVKNGILFGHGSIVKTSGNWAGGDVAARIPAAITNMITSTPSVACVQGSGAGLFANVSGSNLLIGTVTGVPSSPTLILGPGNAVD